VTPARREGNARINYSADNSSAQNKNKSPCSNLIISSFTLGWFGLCRLTNPRIKEDISKLLKEDIIKLLLQFARYCVKAI